MLLEYLFGLFYVRAAMLIDVSGEMRTPVSLGKDHAPPILNGWPYLCHPTLYFSVG